MSEFIATFCPICKDVTQAEVLDETAPPAVIGNMAFNFVRTTSCQGCGEKAHRYEFECGSDV